MLGVWEILLDQVGHREQCQVAFPEGWLRSNRKVGGKSAKAHPYPPLPKGLLSTFEGLPVQFHDKHALGGYFSFSKIIQSLLVGTVRQYGRQEFHSQNPRFCAVLVEAGCLSFNPFDRAICLRWSATFNVNPSQSNKTNGKRGKKMHERTHRNRRHAFMVYVCVVLEPR